MVCVDAVKTIKNTSASQTGAPLTANSAKKAWIEFIGQSFASQMTCGGIRCAASMHAVIYNKRDVLQLRKEWKSYCVMQN